MADAAVAEVKAPAEPKASPAKGRKGGSLLPEKLTGAQRAATVIIALGAERASALYKHMEPDDVEQLTLEVAKMGFLGSEQTEEILYEFYQLCRTNRAVTEGGLEYARTVLEKAYGPQTADELLGSLAAYLAQGGPAKAGETVKFFITGHSRGGAAANLLAARLADSGLVKKEDVFCYTFAAPAVSVEAAEEGYENIFNIVNETDLVTQVPLSAWGYRRYGVDKPLPTGDAALFDGMNRQYKALSGQEYAAYRDPETVERITAAVRRLAPSTSSANMELIAAILNGDLEELSRLMKQGGALSMGRTALRLSAELAPLLGQEQEALRSAHCMAGYYSWLSASPS